MLFLFSLSSNETTRVLQYLGLCHQQKSKIFAYNRIITDILQYHLCSSLLEIVVISVTTRA